MTATTANEFAAASEATKNAKEKEGMSAWGCTWRVTGAIVLFAVVIFALCYGAQFAIGYVAGLGLSALATSIATYAIAGVAYVGSLALGWFTGGYCTRTLGEREAAKCASAA